MGPLISRFRRKQTTVELLEEIDKEINRLQRNRKVNQDRQKQFVTSLLIYSIAAYVIAAIIFFCICFPETWQLRLLYSTPLLIFPILVWVVKRSLHWYFVQRISSNDTALEELRDRKNQILEDVMETETYKKAREILEKFDADRLHQLEGMPDNTPGYPSVSQDIPDNTPEYPRISQGIPEAVADNTPGPARPPRRPAGTMVQQRPRHRRMGLPPPGTFDLVRRASSQEQNGTPHLPSPLIQQQQAGYQAQAAVIGAEFAQPPRPPMARALLPRDRGVMDKLMDYLVGDGPENRYALICQQCFSHNGMALKEEFEYLSFRCCYCYWINPARKQRPTAPRLQFFAPPGMSPAHDSDTSASNEESDDKVKDDKIVSPEKPPPPGSSEGVSAAGELGEPAGQLKKLGEPAGQPGEPARQPQKLGEPAGQPGELGEPAGQSEKLGEPMGQPEEPSGQPREPAGQPGEPAGQPREPAGQPGELGEPAGQPGELGESAGQPGEPAGQPGEPARQPQKLGEPAGQPGEPARQPQKLGEPAGQPGELGEPAGQSEKLGKPMGQPEEPSGQPREPAGQPGEPAGQPREPAGQPGELGEPAGQPGELGESAGQPGEPAGQPGEPAGQPGEPDVRSGCEGLDASLPAGATETSPDSELGESGWKRPAADCHARGDGNCLGEAHASHHVGMSAEMTPSSAASLHTRPGDGLQQATSQKLHSSEILQATATVDQHSGKPHPETLSGEDLRDSLDLSNTGQPLTGADVSDLSNTGQPLTGADVSDLSNTGQPLTGADVSDLSNTGQPLTGADVSDLSNTGQPLTGADVSDLSNTGQPLTGADVSDLSNTGQPLTGADVSDLSNTGQPLTGADVSDLSNTGQPLTGADVSDVAHRTDCDSNSGADIARGGCSRADIARGGCSVAVTAQADLQGLRAGDQDI